MTPLTREWVKKAENDFKVAAQILRRRKDMKKSLKLVEKTTTARSEADVTEPATTLKREEG
jgi:hypothetical protein